MVVVNLGAAPSLLKNSGPRQHWLLVRPVGVRANRDAIGARVIVHAGGRRVSSEMQSGSSYISQNDARPRRIGLEPNLRSDRGGLARWHARAVSGGNRGPRRHADAGRRFAHRGAGRGAACVRVLTLQQEGSGLDSCRQRDVQWLDGTISRYKDGTGT